MTIRIRDHLKLFRNIKRLSQAEFASMIDVSLELLDKYEKGIAEPSAAIYERLAELGCDIQWLITDVERKTSEQLGMTSNKDLQAVLDRAVRAEGARSSRARHCPA